MGIRWAALSCTVTCLPQGVASDGEPACCADLHGHHARVAVAGGAGGRRAAGGAAHARAGQAHAGRVHHHGGHGPCAAAAAAGAHHQRHAGAPAQTPQHWVRVGRRSSACWARSG